jgi:ribose transport system permease protein
MPAEAMRRYGLLIAWLAVIVAFSVLRPETFFTFANFETIAGSQSVLVLIALALIVPMTAGEFDLSVAATANVSAVLIAWLNTDQGMGIVPAVALALALGVVIGLANAFFVIRIGVESIIVTLGMATLLTGAAIGINNETTTISSQALIDAVHTKLAGLPLGFWYGLLATLVVAYVYALTPLGRYLYFVGAGRDVARLSGIAVERVRAGAFVIAATTSALAGVVLAGWIGSADPAIGAPFLLPAFAAAFLGATAITPGRFNPWGTFVAVYFLVTGITGLQLMGFSGWIEQVFYGTSLILAVALSTLAGRRTAPTS